MSREKRSGLGEDLLGSDAVESVDRPRADDTAVVEDFVLSGPGTDSAGIVDRLPGDGERGPVQDSFAGEESTGDDPVDGVGVGIVGGHDLDSPGVLGTHRVDSVDDIGPLDSGPLVESGDRAGAENQHGADEDPGHRGESKNGLGRIGKTMIGLGIAAVLGVMAFAVFEPVQVLPRVRLAPGFTFIDQVGESFTSQDTRGSVTLYSFAPAGCGADCDPIFHTMREVGERVAIEADLGGADFQMVTVALDSNDAAELATAATVSGADGESWRWVGGEPGAIEATVGSGFRVFYDLSQPSDVEFDPVYVITDATGLIRGEYRYSVIASDADRLTRHIALLGDEMRNSEGAASILYEAAHLFLCYP